MAENTVELPEHDHDGLSEPPHEPVVTSAADRRRGWILMGSFALLLMILIGAEILHGLT